jgi:hypothetical protein
VVLAKAHLFAFGARRSPGRLRHEQRAAVLHAAQFKVDVWQIPNLFGWNPYNSPFTLVREAEMLRNRDVELPDRRTYLEDRHTSLQKGYRPIEGVAGARASRQESVLR